MRDLLDFFLSRDAIWDPSVNDQTHVQSLKVTFLNFHKRHAMMYHGVNTAYIHNYTANYYAVIKDCNWDPSWHIQQWIHPSSSFVNLGCPTEHEIEGLDENERRILEKRTLRVIQWTNEAQINLYYGPLVLNVRHYVRFLVHLLSIWSFFGITYGIISDLRFWSLESDPWRTYIGTI